MEKLPYNEIVFKRIAGDCEAEFYNYMPRSSTGMPKWEIKARYKDGMSKVVILQDCGFNITGRIIEIPVFNTRAERNKIIRGLYHKDGLSQVFLGELFRLSQPAISVIINKSEKTAVVKAQPVNVLKGNRLYKSEEPVMNRSKKLAITLAVLAVLGGSVYVQPEQALAAEYVITGDEINHLGDEWRDESTSIALKDSVNDNVIIFKGVEYDNSIYGGWGDKENSSNNTLIFIDSEIGKDSDKSNWGQIGGAWAGPYDPNEPQKTYNADKNTVIVYDSKIHHAIFGGYSRGGSASGNTIVIAGNSIVYGKDIRDNSEPVSGQYIYGGYSWLSATNGDLTNKGTGGIAENNTIIITDNADISGTKIYGGYTSVDDSLDPSSITEADFLKINNTVIFDDWSGSVKAVRSCDNVNFYNVNLSDFVNKTGKPILKITGDGPHDSFENIIGTDGNEITDKYGDTTKNINIGLSFQGGQDINVNDTVRLIQMTDDGVDAIIDKKKGEKIKLANDGTAYAGVAQVLKGKLDVQGKYIDYTIKSVGLNDQVNVVNEGRAASTAFLNQSDELISEALAGLNLEDKYGFETFAMVYGNDSRYGTNSDLSINGWSGLVGVGSNNKTKAGDFAWAAFFENGAGNYDISTTMNGITMEGDGSTVYNGGGIAARLTGENGVYGEASLRAGLLKNDLENGLLGADNNKYGYESESNYYGFHLGIGKIFKLENGASVDTYAKYYHSTVKDDSFTIDGDEFEMDDINSDRLRLGIRYNQGMDRTFNVYYGAAWEYEFNGESNGYAQGHKMEETSLKGSTVIGELGVVIQPENSPWSFDAKVKGYGGQRDGYSGSILATYHF